MKTILLVLILVARALAAPTAADGPPPNAQVGILVPRAVGVAQLADDKARCRDIALIDAQRNAIESGLGVMIQSDTRVEDYQLVNDTIQVDAVKGFCFDLNVLREYEQNDLYVVEISCRVSTIGLVTELADEFPDVYDELQRPRLAILLRETDGQGRETSIVTTALAKALLDRGIDVVEKAQIDALADRDRAAAAAQGDAQAVAWVASQVNCELLINGSAEQTAAGTTVNARLCNGFDARIIGTAIARAATPEEAAARMLPGPTDADDLVTQVLGRWLADPTILTCILSRASYTEVQNFVRGLQGRARPVRVELGQVTAEEASRIPGLGEVILRNFNLAASTIEIRTPLRRQQAIDMLQGVMAGLGYEITGVNMARIDLAKAAPPPAP